MQFSMKQLYLRLICNRKILNTFTTNFTIKCNYARWAHRRPSAIVNEHELFEDVNENNIDTLEVVKERHDGKVRKIKSQKKFSANENNLSNTIANKEIKANNKTDVNKLSNRVINLKENDHIITSLMMNVKSRKMREKNNQICMEGYRLIKDGIEAGVKPEIIFFSRLSDIEDLPLHEEVKLYKVPYRTIQLWSNLTTSPGIIGIFKIPNVESTEPSPNALPLTIICDNIRDPGNLGSVLRVAAGVGCEKIVLLKGCVDLWDTKVLRSAAGAHFRLPIHASVTDELSSFIYDGMNVFVTDNNAANNELVFDHFNSETKYSISKIYENSNFENVELPESDENLQNSKLKKLIRRSQSQLPIVPYYAVDYCTSETAIIVSGETEGLSLETVKFLWEKRAVRLNVPLLNNVESLNISTALGIIAFELQRQIVFKQKE
ncbi:PREDICTED: rRNA methyltransferase 3, mitochondrial [Polistes canadensis]|uniref:rRNA methyltransferase 3, mitochondrial n=1 Tax=Polistes canadensis TaxID=91411 RepID=UPI000718F2D0|nr:PREDICTED: rRNA methyltransferase 3, mitochondrial [Polistes canadensis]